jgi:putative integral membrane protein (TIGR02587 family)
MGLGLLVAAGVLVLLGRIDGETGLQEALGMTIVEAMTVAIGISVGTSQLGIRPDDEGEERGEAQRAPDRETHFRGQMAIAACGAVLFAANIAPTEEVLVIAAESSPVRLLGQALLSLLMSALILNYIEFSGAHRLVRRDGMHTVISETVVTYAIALLASSAVLWFFGRFDGCRPSTAVAQAVVLGLPATLGASAGRLLLQ